MNVTELAKELISRMNNPIVDYDELGCPHIITDGEYTIQTDLFEKVVFRQHTVLGTIEKVFPGYGNDCEALWAMARDLESVSA